MVAIPQPIKRVFERFPLQSLPPINGYNNRDEALQNSRTFYFDGGDDKTTFSLGVYNVLEVSGKLIPSDPISFGIALILAEKNSLKFPKKDSKPNGCHSLIKLSYQASPDLQLPILIEDSGDARNLKTHSAIEKDISSKNFESNSEEGLVNDLIDYSFADIWILTMLSEELPRSVISKIFDIEEGRLGDLTRIQQVSDMQAWRSLRLRYPHLFDSKDLKRTKLKAFYLKSLGDFENTFHLLIDFVNEGKSSHILNLKIAAYVILIDQLLTTRLHDIIKRDATFVEFCYSIFDKY